MTWRMSHRADRECIPIADRHYNRQKPGSPQFVPPGRCLVLKQENALWVTSWPFGRYVKHAWPGAWVNSCFRNEGAGLSSTLILEAIAATRWYYGHPDDHGLLTFVDERKVRHKRDPGRCYLKAGFQIAGRAKDGKLALLMPPAVLCYVPPKAPIGSQASLFGGQSGESK